MYAHVYENRQAAFSDQSESGILQSSRIKSWFSGMLSLGVNVYTTAYVTSVL